MIRDAKSLSGPRVAVVIYDSLCTFEFGIAVEVFGLKRPEVGSNWYQFNVCSIEGRPVRAVGGIEVKADRGLELLEEADLVIVPGWSDPQILPPKELTDTLVAAHQRGARIVGICGGVFVLAASGLLANKRATTHWRFLDQLIESFPSVERCGSSLYCDEDRVLTSAGSSAGIDLCLHIVRSDYGDEVAEQVAERLVFPRQRGGEQQQQLPLQRVPKTKDQQFLDFLDKLDADVASNPTIANAAQELELSPRTFNRRIKQLTGQTYCEWMSNKRLERAKRLLLKTDLPVEKIAEACGLASASSLRRLFRREEGYLPNEYRKAAQGL
ncbi:MAG: helix-turn-helix domain-containing protein [Pirellulaceae bacterium]